MTTTITSTTPSWFAAFKDQILLGLSMTTKVIQETALKYVEAIDKDPTFRDYLADEAPEVSGSVWRTLEKVGRGSLDARIAAGGCPYGNKLRRLPISEQRRAIENPLPLLTVGGDTLQVSLDAMLPKQADQMFAAQHIRSLPEQRAWIEAQNAATAAKAKPANAVEIDKRHRRIVVNGHVLTAADLADYLRKISE